MAVWRLSSAENVKLKICEEATSSLHYAQGVFDHRMFAPCATQSTTDVHCQPWVPDSTARAYTFVQLKWQSDGHFDGIATSTVVAFVIIPFQTSCMSFTPWNKNLDGSDETCLIKWCGNFCLPVSWKATYPKLKGNISTKGNHPTTSMVPEQFVLQNGSGCHSCHSRVLLRLEVWCFPWTWSWECWATYLLR